MSWIQALIIAPFIVILWAAAMMAVIGLWLTFKDLIIERKKPK